MEENKLNNQKNNILKLVEQYYENNLAVKEFNREKDYVNYSGRVFDHKEVKILIDSALDFWLTAGKYAKKFEKNLANYLGVRKSMLTNSGSSANLLALSALTSEKLGKRRLLDQDEVITVAAGFPTTVNPIYQNNLVPVYCDIDIKTKNIDTNKLEDAITKKTKAIMLAHSLGNPFDLDVIKYLCNKYNLWLIEDNCDALGSTWDGKLTGTFGDLSTQSFYPPHHITTGEGGSINTSNPKLSKIVESFRDWGRDCWCESGVDNSCGKRFNWELGDLPYGYDHKYIYSHIGYNLKITDLQAAIGIEQLKKLPSFIKSRKDNHEFFNNFFKKYEEYFFLPKKYKKADPSWFGYILTLKKNAPFDRNKIVRYLEKNRIATRMLFGGNLIKQPAYAKKRHKIFGVLNNTDYVMTNSFWIGVYPGITKKMRNYVSAVFDDFFDNEL